MQNVILEIDRICGRLRWFTGEALAEKCPAEAFVMSAGNAFLSAARAGRRRPSQAPPAVMPIFAPSRCLLWGRTASSCRRARRRICRAGKGLYGPLHGQARLEVCRFRPQGGELFREHRECQHGGGKRLVFRVSGGKGGYRVMDVNASSVWLAGQMRSTFVGVINRNHGDFKALMSYLQ